MTTRDLGDAAPNEWKVYERQYQTTCTNFDSFADFRQAILDFRTQLTADQLGLVCEWITIGRDNPWIAEAYDPPFNELSFRICQDFRELADRLLHGNWCLGQAFALENLCFINQIDGGDEWLTIRGKIPFESITMQARDESRDQAEARLRETIDRIQRASDEQLRDLDY